MAETSKNKIYYNDKEDSIADILADMKKLAESTDNAIENSKYDDTELKKKNETQDTSIEELQTKVATLETENTELQTECKRLREDNNAIAIIGQASGENITLNDSSDARFKKFEISGNSKQETREGYNLFNYENVQYGKSISSSTGKLEDSTSYVFCGYIAVKPNTTYTRSSVGTNGIAALDSDKNYITAINGTTFTTPDNCYFIGFNMSLTYYNDESYKLFVINEGTEIKPYEPYGVMPSPAYPSEIKTVGDNIQLFDKDNVTYISNKIKDDNGTEIAQGGFDYTSSYIEVQPNTIYTLSGKLTNNSGTVRVYYYDINKNWISRSSGFGANVNICTFTTPSNCYFIQYHYIRAVYDANTIKLEKGSVASPYSPYGQGCAEIKVCNKNLLKLKYGKKITFSGLTVAIEEDGTISLNGTIEENMGWPTFLISGEGDIKTNGSSPFIEQFPHWYRSINLPKDKYKLSMFYISGTTSGNLNYRPYVYVHTSNGENKEFGQGIQGTKTKSYIGDICGVSFYVDSGTTWNDFKFKLQVVKEEEYIDEKTYELHQSRTKVIPIQKEFCKIGDVEDTFVKVDGKWYEKHYIDRVILNGTNLQFRINNSTKSGLTQFASSVLNDIYKETFGVFFSNYFKCQQNDYNLINGYARLTNGFFIPTISNSIIGVNDEDSDTVKLNAFYNWFKNNNMDLYYRLAEPELIPCTAEQIKILDEIEKTLHSYKGITHIFSTDEISPIFNIEYSKDTQAYIDSKINELATAVVELGGNINV